MYHMSAAKVSEKEEKSVIKCKIHNNNNNKGIKYAEGSSSSSAEIRETECCMKRKE